jgi:acyl carrier protein
MSMVDSHQARFERIVELIRRAMPVPPLESFIWLPHHRLRDELGYDSIGLMTLAFHIELEYEVDVGAHAEAYQRMQTVSDVVDFVSGLTS